MANITYTTSAGTFTAVLPADIMVNPDWAWEYLKANYLDQPTTNVTIDGVPYKTGGTIVATSYPAAGLGGAGSVAAAGWGPEAEYLQSIGQGLPGYRNPAQTYLANLYDPLRALWGAEQKFNPQLGLGGAKDWTDYIPGMGIATSGYGAITSRANDLLNRLLQMTTAGRGERGLTTEAQYEPVSGRPYSFAEGEMTPEDLAGLVEMGGAPQFGRLGARYVAGRLPEMRKQWGAAGAGGAQPLSFLDYFKQRYGL